MGGESIGHHPKEPAIGDDAKAWVVHVACSKPKDLGYAAETWSAAKAAKATVRRILAEQPPHPEKVKYYLERRDPASRLSFTARPDDAFRLNQDFHRVRSEPTRRAAIIRFRVSADGFADVSVHVDMLAVNRRENTLGARRIYRTITSSAHLRPRRAHLLRRSHFTVNNRVGRIQGEIFVFEILETTRTGRRILRTAAETLGSASVVAALLGCASGLGMAQTPGSLDPTFGIDGIVTTDGLFEGQNVMPLTAIEQPGGKIVVILGINNIVATEAFGLARFTSTGKLDTTFGTKGVTMVGFTDFINEPNSVAVQPNGDILVAGFSETTSGGFNFAMARFTPNGQLDNTFGNAGLVTVQPPGVQPTAMVVMAQPNGQILEGGSVIGMNKNEPGATVLGRYNSDGSLDSTFGTNGFAESQASVGAPTALALLANGSYLALGTFGAIAEFSSTGVLQPTVTADTLVATSRPGQAFANPVLFQPSGDFIEGTFVGEGHGDAKTDDQIFRFSATGAVIPSFNTTPFAFPGESTNNPQALARQSNGQILVSGVPFGLARLNTNGELDTTFGTGGTVETPGGQVTGLLIQTDGKIVAIGSEPPNGVVSEHLMLARYLAN